MSEVAPWDDSRRKRLLTDLSTKGVRQTRDFSVVRTLPATYPFKPVVHEDKTRTKARRAYESEKPEQYDISWYMLTSSIRPDVRLAQEGNIWVEEQPGGGAIHLCLERGIWSQWPGNAGGRLTTHPYIKSLVLIFTGKKWRWGAKGSLAALRSNWPKKAAYENARKVILGPDAVEDGDDELNLENLTPAQTIKIWRSWQSTQLQPSVSEKATKISSEHQDAQISPPLYDTAGRRLSKGRGVTTESKNLQPPEPGSPKPAPCAPQHAVKKPNMFGGSPSSSRNTQTARPRGSTLPGAQSRKALANSDHAPSSQSHTGASLHDRPRAEAQDVPMTTSTEKESPLVERTQPAPACPPSGEHEQPSDNESKDVGNPSLQDLGAPEESSSNVRVDPEPLFTPPPESQTTMTSAQTGPPLLSPGEASGHPPAASGTTVHAGDERIAQPLVLSGGADLSEPWARLLERAELRTDKSERENSLLRTKIDRLENERRELMKKQGATTQDPKSSPEYRKLHDAYKKLKDAQEENTRKFESERKSLQEAYLIARQDVQRLEEDMKVRENELEMTQKSHRATLEYAMKLDGLLNGEHVEPAQSSVAKRKRTCSTSNASNAADDGSEDPRASSQQSASTSQHADFDVRQKRQRRASAAETSNHHGSPTSPPAHARGGFVPNYLEQAKQPS